MSLIDEGWKLQYLTIYVSPSVNTFDILGFSVKRHLNQYTFIPNISAFLR